MFKFSSLLLMALALLVMGCEKENVAATGSSTRTAAPPETTFASCDCGLNEEGGSPSEYIKAEIENVPVCFDVVPNMNDTFPNMLRYGSLARIGAEHYDLLYMLRNTRNGLWQAAIFLENSGALMNPYPYVIPGLNPQKSASGELQLNDLNHYVNCYSCAENKFNYFERIGSTGIKMTATGFINNYFEGTFEGTAYTGSGRKITIKNGQFRIRLVVYKEDFK